MNFFSPENPFLLEVTPFPGSGRPHPPGFLVWPAAPSQPPPWVSLPLRSLRSRYSFRSRLGSLLASWPVSILSFVTFCVLMTSRFVSSLRLSPGPSIHLHGHSLVFSPKRDVCTLSSTLAASAGVLPGPQAASSSECMSQKRDCRPPSRPGSNQGSAHSRLP